jgi:UDP-3-O-[3-hydroxymyristoyl] glucosamine N-acyltransferase
MKVYELAELVGGRLLGEREKEILRIADLEHADQDEVAYVESEKFLSSASESRAGGLIVTPGVAAELQDLSAAGEQGRPLIEVGNPKLAFALIGAALHPPLRREPEIHGTAVVAQSADVALTAYLGPHVQIGENARVGAFTRIEAGVVVGANVTIGANCVLHPNVVLYDGVTIGDRVILHAAVCIGADGFGYVRHDHGYQKFPQIGTVVIEDEVELGAHTCVDRAALGRTRIGRGTKLDNMVHVGHNCDIGERVVIAAQTGISGSVVIEDDAVIGGQVGFGDHIRVQKGAVIGSKAGVLPGKIVRPGVWWGIPIQPLDQYKRMNAFINRLPERLKRLEEQLAELKRDTDLDG